MVSTLDLINFGTHKLGDTIKNSMTFQTVDPERARFWFFIKGSGTSFSTIFYV